MQYKYVAFKQSCLKAWLYKWKNLSMNCKKKLILNSDIDQLQQLGRCFR